MANSPWEMLSALGTLAAVGVALSVTWWSERQRRITESNRGKLVASRLIEPIRVLEDELRNEMLLFYLRNEDDGTDDSYALRVARLGALAGSINVDTLRDLSSLPNGCAGRLAVALGIIEVLARDIEAVTSTRKWSDLIELQRNIYVSKWREQAGEGAGYLAVVLRELQKASDQIATFPTPEELYEPDVQQ